MGNIISMVNVGEKKKMVVFLRWLPNSVISRVPSHEVQYPVTYCGVGEKKSHWD